jgi:hypothetical protein
MSMFSDRAPRPRAAILARRPELIDAAVRRVLDEPAARQVLATGTDEPWVRLIVNVIRAEFRLLVLTEGKPL